MTGVCGTGRLVTATATFVQPIQDTAITQTLISIFRGSTQSDYKLELIVVLVRLVSESQ